MLICNALRVKGVVPYKDSTFEFTRGIHTVYGLNRTAPGSKNANGAGKSRFFSMLPELIFGSPVQGTQQDRVQEGEVWLQAELNGVGYVFHRKDGKLQIKDSDGTLVCKNVADTKAWVAANVPLTEIGADTYLFIDSQRPHPLVKGSTADRKNFLEAFFDLEKITLEKVKVQAALAELKPLRAGYEKLAQERDRLRAEVAALGLSYKDRKAQVAELSAKMEALTATANQYAELRRARQYIEDNAKLISSVVGHLDDVEGAIVASKKRIAQRQQEVTLAIEYEAYLRQVARYKEALESVSEQAQPYLNNRKLAQKHHDLYLDTERGLDIFYRDPGEPDKPVPVKLPDIAPDRNLEDIYADKQAAEGQLKHALEFGKGTCPTCGQSVKTHNPSELKERISGYLKQIQAIEAWNQYMYDEKAYGVALEERNEVLERRKCQLAEMAKLKPAYEAWLELRKVPVEPEPFEGPHLSMDDCQQQLLEAKQLLNNLQLIAPSVGLIELANENQEVVIPDNSTELKLLTDEYAQAQAKLEVTRTYLLRIKSMNEDLAGMEDQLSKEELLNILSEAYNERGGLRKMAVQAISHSLIGQINKYAAHIFSEDYRFEMDWNAAQINLLCHRQYKGKIITSDVRKLSGAESRLFTYVLTLALLTFVPDNKRVSVMILDEPTTNMGNENREAFKELLTAMANIIPTIIVLTPNFDEAYDGATCWTAVKRNGVSTLESGHPNQIQD
jgi:DNA repair exonuclease SbcCD ATPase subunit